MQNPSRKTDDGVLRHLNVKTTVFTEYLFGNFSA
jgi:hypothetical protein